MRGGTSVLAVVLIASSSLAGKGQSVSKADPESGVVPFYRVWFERRDPVSGALASAAIVPPFQCTNDGTFFVSFINTVPAGVGLPPPPP